ncbi:MAG: hypothetical protein H6708_02770 [Kofleriaceae bacterium]|nr:hypothetical protein [Kofleriaceae bacterium]
MTTVPSEGREAAYEDCIRSAPALESTRKVLGAFAKLSRPVMMVGDLWTTRALLPDLLVDASLVLPVDCRQSREGPLSEVLADALGARHRHRGPGVVALFEIDRLGRQDLDYVGALARDARLDAYGTPFGARLVCHANSHGEDAELGLARGTFLDVDVPALVERPDDALYMLETLVRQLLPGRSFTTDARNAILGHPWSGDAPELVALVERLEARASLGELPDDISPEVLGLAPVATVRQLARMRVPSGRELRDLVAEFEAEVIRATMERLQGNKSQAAKALGISRSHLINKCREYGID